VSKSEEKLLHSKSAAVVARADFGVSDSVYNAILWHTTGRAEMTKLEKIIYLADYIEPTRKFEGVDDLRALSYNDLDKAMEMGIMIVVEDLKARGIMPNQTTIDALKEFTRSGT
jgi:nicotinate-nucleotide adenylyltransferase